MDPQHPAFGVALITILCRCIRVSSMAVAVLVTPANAADVVPHRATYDMKLSTAKRSSGVVEVRGVMIMETIDACDAWESKQRIQLTFLRNDSEEFTTDSTFASFEQKGGGMLQFSVRNAQNGEPDDELRGTAEMMPGAAGKAQFSLPERRQFDLPMGTLFPVSHLSQLIDDAKAGETVKSYSVFDGARLDGAFKVNAVMARLTRPTGPAPRGDVALLRGQPGWAVRLAFFAANEREGQPEYEVAMDLYANGIARAMVLDYGDLAIDAKLQRIEALPRPKC